MAVFCTKCGTPNDDGAGFCESCGTKFRVDLVNAPVQAKAGFINPKKMVYAGAALSGVLVLAGGVKYFFMGSPTPTASILLAATKAAYGKEANNRTKDSQLCLTNIDYSKNIFNVAEADAAGQLWMNTLVAAGLYSPSVSVSAAGFSTSTMLQYTATEQLAKYREGARLCTAKDVEVVDVVNIEKPVPQSIGPAGSSTKILEVKAQLVLKALNAAPWLDNPEVREKVLAKISGWVYKDQSLQKQINQYFGLIDGKWTAGSAYKNAIREQLTSAQRNNEFKDEIIEHARNASGMAELFSGIASSLFSGFGGNSNPLFGRWRSTVDGREVGFSASSCVAWSTGSNERCTYHIDGKTITFKSNFQSNVFPEGQGYAVMQGQDLMSIDNGRRRTTFRRIK